MMTNIVINILKNNYFKEAINFPKCATQYSSGFDLIATSDPEIVGTKYDGNNNLTLYKDVSYIQYHTGLFIKITGNVIIDSLIFPRSSISKYNLQLANSIGLCDNDYIGEYLVRFNYVWQPSDFIIKTINNCQCVLGAINTDKIYKKGDKICQLKFTQVIHPIFKLVDSLEKTERGNGGFGSTDIKNQDNSFIKEYYKQHVNMNRQTRYTDFFIKKLETEQEQLNNITKGSSNE